MSEIRRYDDDQVREIIRRASEADAASPGGASGTGTAEGMTLTQIQDIAREVGLDPMLVARAAARVGGGGVDGDPSHRMLGIPISVGHVVELPARLSDDEWDQMVVRFREIFHARGKVIQEGGLRGWANGNLQILEEPTAAGYRLRMRSVSGNAQGAIMGGAAGLTLGTGLLLLGLTQLGGIMSLPEALLIGGSFAGGGGALLWRGKVGTSLWIATRKAQFRELGEWAMLRISGGSDVGGARPTQGDAGLQGAPTTREMEA